MLRISSALRCEKIQMHARTIRVVCIFVGYKLATAYNRRTVLKDESLRLKFVPDTSMWFQEVNSVVAAASSSLPATRNSAFAFASRYKTWKDCRPQQQDPASR